MELTEEEMQQLVQAEQELAQGFEVGGPPMTAELAPFQMSESAFGAAGSGTAKHVLLDHYFTSSLRRLWAHVGGTWRGRNVTNTEEQGLVQVAFASNRVDAWWDNSNNLTILRCWKHL